MSQILFYLCTCLCNFTEETAVETQNTQSWLALSQETCGYLSDGKCCIIWLCSIICPFNSLFKLKMWLTGCTKDCCLHLQPLVKMSADVALLCHLQMLFFISMINNKQLGQMPKLFHFICLKWTVKPEWHHEHLFVILVLRLLLSAGVRSALQEADLTKNSLQWSNSISTATKYDPID